MHEVDSTGDSLRRRTGSAHQPVALDASLRGVHDELRASAGRGDLAAAETTLREALTALEESGANRDARAELLATGAEVLREAGAPEERWLPLVERGIGQCGERRDTTWARLTLIPSPPMEELFSGRIYAGRWLGANPDAVRILRESGNEDDYARTLWVYERRTLEQTRALLDRSRDWKRSAARMRAVSVAAETLQYYHGAYFEAHAALEELLGLSERYGSLQEQAKALIRLALVRISLGELAIALETAERARATLSRLGPGEMLYEHAGTTKGGDMYPGPSMDANFAMYLERDWLAVARHWEAAVAIREPGGSPVYVIEAGMAAQAYARAGEPARCRALLDALTPILARLEPGDWAYNGAVGRAAHAIWDTGAVEYATAYRDFALRLVAEPEVGDWNASSNELSVACMVALLGESSQAQEYFERARDALAASGQRALLVAVDLYEAQALQRAGSAESARIRAFLEAVMRRAHEMGMEGWGERAREVGSLAGLAPLHC